MKKLRLAPPKPRRRLRVPNNPSPYGIPIRPPGYFADMYLKEEAEWENEVGKASLVQAPEDLE